MYGLGRSADTMEQGAVDDRVATAKLHLFERTTHPDRNGGFVAECKGKGKERPARRTSWHDPSTTIRANTVRGLWGAHLRDVFWGCLAHME